MAIIVLGVLVAMSFAKVKELNEANTYLNQELMQNRQTVYVATTLIEKGSTIETSGDNANVMQQVICSGLESYNYITSADIGTKAVVDIPAGIPVMYNMITTIDVTNDLREYEISAVNLMTDQAVNDVIDVRMTFPDGTDYVVLSKKQVLSMDLTNCVYTVHLNEEEILRFTCAMVDAYITTGARLYTTRYVADSLQNEATVNYPVSEAVRSLISSDPNVVTLAADTLNASARLNLETRLGLLSEDQLEAVNEGFGLADTAKNSVIGNQTNGTDTEGNTSTDVQTETGMETDVTGPADEEAASEQ